MSEKNTVLIAAAAACEALFRKKGMGGKSEERESVPNPWQSLGHWRMGGE
jgi:hypothetical protein